MPDSIIGTIVTHANLYHVRGASTGVVEAIAPNNELQIWWEDDGENQITPAFRSYPLEELIIKNERPENY